MSIKSYWYDTEWQALVIKLHQDMLDENALYEELADESEKMSDDDYHRMEKYYLGSSRRENAASKEPANDSPEELL